MAGQDDLDALIRGYADSPAYKADLERQRREAEAARLREAERNRLQREKTERETNAPGRVNRGLQQWINPEMYRAPSAPARPTPSGMLPGGMNGVRGTLSPEVLFAMLLRSRGMLG